MKLTKKLAALVLAMMMALSVMAMPAAAYGGDSGVMPLGTAVRTCSECGRSVSAQTSTERSPKTVNSCSASSSAHTHTVTKTTYTFNCSCGAYLGTSYTTDTYCPYGGH